ncbi:hypothetical protein Patl1_05021 [Pistacia atlantica]|uniref:Uncharacterized protein n=1 Tax=Pistacia atlantica TaxID=434234 RepID=A0ACC1BUT4_9ROSI|nr:hypothetical protein Patl1_05021 [Pistacia atlantica]
MNDTISIHKFKRRKFLMGEDADKGEDKICKLPDSILHKILSLLPIEDVLRTSLLSKRWRYLWTSISDLDFFENSLFCRPFLADTNFVNSVERLLLLHDSSNIQKFHLKLDLSVCPLRVTTWIAAAVRCQVQEFDLSLPNEVPVVLPDNLFTCELLKKLKLQMNSIFIFPDLIHMTNLTTLHVTATFPYDRSTENLFSGCPLLQELVLHNCVWRHSDIITISVPNIRTLTISRDCLQPFPHGFYDSVRISAPKLTSLKCINYLSGEVFLCNLPSLVDAYIDIQGMKYMDVVVHERAIKLLGGVCKVKSLTVSNRTLPVGNAKLIFASYDIFRVPLPVFGNLTHLKVNSVHRHTSAELLHILRKSTNLESLEMPMVRNQKPSLVFSYCTLRHYDSILLENSDLDRILPECGGGCIFSKTFIAKCNGAGEDNNNLFRGHCAEFEDAKEDY